MKTIYYNGIIKTMNEHNDVVEAVCIENGKITYVGSIKEVLKQKNEDTQCIDLNNKVMLPGLIDSHSHFVGVANSLSQCDLSDCKSFADIINKMKKFIKNESIQENQWVYGCNYDHNFLEENTHPTKAILDQISTVYPVVIVHASNHMGVANTKALEVSHIDNNIEDSESGKYGREDGKLNGYLEENAFINFQKNAPMISVQQLLNLMARAQDIYASYGITTLQEGMVNDELWGLLKYASDSGLFKLDVVGYVDLASSRHILLDNPDYVGKYKNHLRIGGYKIFLDGSPQGKTAYLTSPYEGEENYCGYPTLSDQEVINFYQQAKDDHQQILAHCNGDGACEQFIHAGEIVGLGYRPVMIHAQLVTEKQLQRMAKIKMMLSFFVSHTYYWGDIHIKNFGYERAKNISPVKTAINYSIPYTFHQDSPVLPPNLMKAMQCAMERKTKSGILLNQDECVNEEEALRAVTINGAFQYFEENKKGSIEVGKNADLVIMNKDGDVLHTIKDGNCIYSKNHSEISSL